MKEKQGQPNKSRCVLFTSPDGRLSYSTYTFEADARSIETSMSDIGFVMMGRISVVEALQRIKEQGRRLPRERLLL